MVVVVVVVDNLTAHTDVTGAVTLGTDSTVLSCSKQRYTASSSCSNLPPIAISTVVSNAPTRRY